MFFYKERKTSCKNFLNKTISLESYKNENFYKWMRQILTMKSIYKLRSKIRYERVTLEGLIFFNTVKPKI